MQEEFKRGTVVSDSIRPARKRPGPVVLADDCAEWFFDLGEGPLAWDWEVPPVVEQMRRVRTPRTHRHSRHLLVQAYSATVGDHLALESGLEHDLVRQLDRLQHTKWLVSQPCRLRLPARRTGRQVEHIPDLLSLSTHGEATVWDVRAGSRQDEDFRIRSELTRQACLAVGWRYEVFAGWTPVFRSNLIWLTSYRRVMPWYESGLRVIVDSLGSEFQLGSVLALDSGCGHTTSAMWHGLWSGLLLCDLAQPFATSTVVSVQEQLS